MANIPRKHHFLPQFYLAGFTKSGTTDGELFVLDQEQIKQWKSSPAKSAYQRDFYALDFGADVDPAGIEKFLANFEGRCSTVLRQMIESKSLPTGESFDIFLNFVALMFVCVPKTRKMLSEAMDRVGKSLLRTMLSRQEGWEQFKSTIEEQGRNCEHTHEEMKAFVDGDDYTVDYDQNSHIDTMIDMVGIMLPALANRQWTLWTVKDGAPDLICCDRPVSLTWTVPVHGPIPPGFGLRNTTLTFPFNRRIVAISSFEGQKELELGEPLVAWINSLVGSGGNQIYSSEADFIWMTQNYQIGKPDDLIAALSAEKQRRPDAEYNGTPETPKKPTNTSDLSEPI